MGTPQKPVPASRRVAFQNLLESRPKGAATLSGYLLEPILYSKLSIFFHFASARRPSPSRVASHRDPPQLEPSRCPKTLCFKRFCPPRASPRRLAFQSAPGELSIFASADPCRKLAILHSENDHLGHFCLKVATRASKPRFPPPRTPAENWPFYTAKMTIWDTFASKSLPRPQSLDFRLRGPLPKTAHSTQRK